MSYFTDIFIRRPVLAMVINLLILLVGLRSIGLLNVREYPRSEKAVVTVTTVYTGAAAELVEGFITTPLERQIASADGIDYVESTSVQGLSSISANLELNYDPWEALTQISSKVDQVRNELPEGSEDPTIDVTIGETTASMYLSFYSDVLDSNQITDYLIRVVQPQLEAVSGIQQAQVLGARRFAMRIWLKPDRMAALGVTAGDVRQALLANNYLAALGGTKGQMISVNIKAATDLHTADEFRALIIREQDDAIIRLEDVADVQLGAESYDTSVSFNGENATFIGVTVLPNANPLDVIAEIRARWPEITAQLPEGLEARIPYDATRYINDAMREVMITLVEAVLIVLAVIFVFLGSLRSVIIPVVAVPLSLIGAAFIMLAMGFSINLLTLLAMVLAIGLVVDDAIIVVENIHRHMEEGMKPREAAVRGARELGTPIIAMTLTLAAVYAPIGFMGGLTGTLFTEFAFALAGAVIISGVVALTLSPMMCSRLLSEHEGKEGFVHWLDTQFERLRRTYQSGLHRALSNVPVIAVFGVVILASIYFLFITSRHELAPTEDQGLILASATGMPNASIDQTEMFTAELTEIFQSYPETENIFLLNGLGGGNAAGASNTAIAGMVFKPWSERERSQMELMPLVQNDLNGIAGMQVVAFPRPPLPGAGRGLPVQFVIKSTQPPEAMYQVSQQLVGAAWQSGLFAYVDSDLRLDRPQINVEVDRDKAAQLGIDMRDLGGNLSGMLSGAWVNRFNIQGRAYKVIPQVERVYRLNPEQIEQYYLRTGTGELVPASALVSLTRSVEPRKLSRFQQSNAATISGVPRPGVSIDEALGFLRGEAGNLPREYGIDFSGQSRQYVQEGASLTLTFFFAIIVIFLVLAAQFESFRDPLIMLVSVPMSIAGALVFVSLGLTSINIYTQVGLITLIGLISKHGILIVQFANQLQIQEGYDKREAVERAAGIRLRPILMTTGAMALGVVPLLVASGPGAEARFAIGLTLFTGLTIGTLFTLFVVPGVYLLLARDHRAPAAGSEPVYGER